jgi:hypothetical protein
MGLAKNMTAYGIAAIAHNLRKGAKFLTLYGQPDPNYARQLRFKPRNGTTNQAKLSISNCKIRKQLFKMGVYLKRDNIKLENRPYTEVSK